MVGRIAITLCVLVKAATACPPGPEPATTQDPHGLAVALALMGISTLLFAITRSNAVRRTFVTSRRKLESSLEVARALARIQRRRAVLFSIGCAAATIASAMTSLDVDTRAALMITPAVLFAIGLATLARLDRVLGIPEDTQLVTVAHGEFLYVARGDVLVAWIAAPPRQVARVLAVPTAVARPHPPSTTTRM